MKVAEKGKEGKAAEKGKEGKAAEKGKEGKAAEEGEGEGGCGGGRRRGRLWRREKEREAAEKGKESVSVAQSHVLRRETITASLERVRHLWHKLQCLCTHHPAEVVCLFVLFAHQTRVCLVCSPSTSSGSFWRERKSTIIWGYSSCIACHIISTIIIMVGNAVNGS